jgi:dienelactone hydrolase
VIAPIYRNWIENWENRLAFRSTDRVARPFEWGFEWTEAWPVDAGARNGEGEAAWAALLNRQAIAQSERFFGHETPRDFELRDELLTFTSPAESPHPENNRVHAQWYPVPKREGKRNDRAVIVLPHWNASLAQHGGLCRGLQKFGIPNMRLSLPYHDYRMPPELTRADFAVSSNICRTLEATRQAVLDIRCCVDWLSLQGYSRVGIVGTSLGSCYAFLASAHDARLNVNVFNHCSSHFGDVVWTGLSTRHIRQTVEGNLDREGLRRVWQAISPVNYMARFAGLSKDGAKRSHFIYAKYDTTFLPELSREILDCVRAHGIDHRLTVLPCGHYTIGETPFKFMDGYLIVSTFLRWL